MILSERKKIPLWEEGEYNYPGAFGFSPFIMTYEEKNGETEETAETGKTGGPAVASAKQPAVLVVPGGGYRLVSPSEADPVAKFFHRKGFRAFILTYSTNFTGQFPLGFWPLYDISRAVRLLRKNAQEWGIDETALCVCGFSAGGHLCASLCTHCKDIVDENPLYRNISNRPDGAVLSYPVITSKEFAHVDSFKMLLGKEASPEDREYMSLEKQVHEGMPPCFLWHTVKDEGVSVQNSLLFARACAAKGVSHALHIFSDGPHGLSVANGEWLAGEYGEPYSLEQLHLLLAAAEEKRLILPSEMFAALKNEASGRKKRTADEIKYLEAVISEVGIWPDAAAGWLQKIFNLKKGEVA